MNELMTFLVKDCFILVKWLHHLVSGWDNEILHWRGGLIEEG
jgi:hypothetical protein